MKSYKERTEKVMEKANTQKRKRRKMITAICSVGACAALLLAFNLTLFVPYTKGAYSVDLKPYQDSEYYSLIQTLSGLTHSSSKGYKTNNFEQWFPRKNYAAPGDASPPPIASDGNFAAAVPDSSNGNFEGDNGNYQEVTDNQTVGVTEGDLFKRSDKYIFYLNLNPVYTSGKTNSYALEVYSIAGENSQKISSYAISPENEAHFNHYSGGFEIFLSEDCSTVTVVASMYSPQVYTALIALDVRDVQNIKEIGRSYVSGKYVSSRTVDGQVLLVSNFAVRYRPDFSDESQFLPQTGKWGELKSLPVKDIVCPGNANSASYTVVSAFDEKTFELTDSVAFLSFSSDIYVSVENLYVVRNYTAVPEGKNVAAPGVRIERVSYGGGKLEIRNSTDVAGTLLNRYCMDEYQGVLRVVTTVGENRFSQSASLYCLNAETFEQIAAVEKFAPFGEEVKSARIYGDIAYVCTAETNAVINTDPVYMFDLSDYKNITYKDTGTIPGYSLSLTAFKDGTLVGIGYGDWRSTLKVEVYEETDSQVVSVTEYILDDTSFSQDYKAYFIDKENGLVGLGVNGSRGAASYFVLWFDGYDLMKLDLDIVFNSGYSNMGYVRACYVDDYLYVLSANEFHAVKLW